MVLGTSTQLVPQRTQSEGVVRSRFVYAWLEDLGAVERRAAEINGQPGAVFFDAESRAVLVITLDIAGGQVIALRSITNPEKLRHLHGRATQAHEN